MRRLTGPTMAQSAMAGELSPEEAGTMIGTLLRQLHALPGRSPEAPPHHRVLHLDLHPENILITSDGPMVIDWATAEEGPPGLDRAMSALILAEVVVADGPAAAGSRVALAALLAEFGDGEFGKVEKAEVGRCPKGQLARARARRAANPTLGSAEIARLDAAVELVMRLAESAAPRP
ncbi:phosphotransferase [Streptomyces venezuelae]|uniref:phosphotransferase n=1 Tax=Streptomyces venezuelae TaxID=54571 RepID=UPI003669DE53